MIFTLSIDYKKHRYKISIDGMEYLQLGSIMLWYVM